MRYVVVAFLLIFFLSFFSCLFVIKVEYAIEAINNAGTCVGILAKDGIVMASERRITSGLLAPAKVSGYHIEATQPLDFATWRRQ
jgi:hypothetical protein